MSPQVIHNLIHTSSSTQPLPRDLINTTSFIQPLQVLLHDLIHSASSTRSIHTTSSSTQPYPHNLIHTTSSTQRHPTSFYTTSSTPSYPHNLIHTTSSTQPHPLHLIHTTSSTSTLSTQPHPHNLIHTNLIHTTSSTQPHPHNLFRFFYMTSSTRPHPHNLNYPHNLIHTRDLIHNSNPPIILGKRAFSVIGPQLWHSFNPLVPGIFIHSSHSKQHGKYCTKFDSEFQLNVKGYKGQALTYTLYTIHPLCKLFLSNYKSQNTPLSDLFKTALLPSGLSTRILILAILKPVTGLRGAL